MSKYISAKAYKNEMLLSADCIGTLGRTSFPENSKQKTNAFFKMIVTGIKGDRLKTVLKYDWANKTNLERVQMTTLATPKKDGYLLLLVPKLLEKEPSDKEEIYLKSRYPQGPYLYLTLFVKLTTETDTVVVSYPIYFIWQKENEQWKIVHINTICI